MNRKQTTKDTERTLLQNRSLHLFCKLLADEINEQGHTLQEVVSQIKRAEIKATQHNVKEVLFKPMAKALFGVDSTTKLKRSEVGQVHEMLMAFMGQNFPNVRYVEFPNDETIDSNGIEIGDN